MTEEKLNILSQKVMQDPEKIQKMIITKTTIQNRLVSIITESQKENLRNGNRDEKTISDTISIAKKHLSSLESDETNIFLVSMATSVVLKELDFTDYSSLNGINIIYNQIS